MLVMNDGGTGNEKKLVDARIAAFKNISKYFSAVAAKNLFLFRHI